MEKKDIELVYTNQKETQEVKKKLYELNNGFCPLLNTKIPLDKMVADHQHKLKKEACSTWEDGGKGLIRGAVEFRANAIEGKIANAWKRYGLDKEYNLPDFLRNLANYLENPPAKKLDKCFVYYTEKPKRIKLKKSEQNRINKYYLKLYPKRKKIPKYTYLNKEVMELLKMIDNYRFNKLKTSKEKK